MTANFELVRYDAMCRAIAEAYDVDEVKDIRDKAIAMEAYFRQAKNPEPERRACEIRLRAERKAGKLLAEMERSKGGRPDKNSGQPEPSFYASAKRENVISDTQAKRWQQLAAMPEDDFEAALAGPEKPSTSGIINGGQKQEAMDPKALWLWGRLRDFEREGLLDTGPQYLISQMTDGMRADVLRLSGLVADWLYGVADNE